MHRAANATALWHAEAMLRHDRRRALRELERIFESGTAPERLEGPLPGRLVAMALGPGLDFVFESIARLYMPWTGKVSTPRRRRDATTSFEAPGRSSESCGPGTGISASTRRRNTTFRFDTSIGPSALVPGMSVLLIDYDDPSTPWPVRLVLDEVVDVGDGEHLGQALMRSRRGFRRVAWFALRTRS